MNVQPLFIAPPASALTAPLRPANTRPASTRYAETTAAESTAAGRMRQLGLPVRPAAVTLSNATPGAELAIVRVSDAAPALLAYLAQVGLAANTRLTVQKHRSNSAVMTVQIRGHHDTIHLGSVASDALWVQSTAA